MTLAEFTAIQMEMAKPEYIGLSDQEAALVYNAKTVQAFKTVSGSEIVNEITAAELDALTTDQRLNLLLIKDGAPLDLETAEGVAKLDIIFANGSAVHTRIMGLRNTVKPAFNQITTHGVQVVRGVV